MPRYKIAHIKERDANGHDVHLIIVRLETAFGDKTRQQQDAAVAEFQMRASAADLAGAVVPVREGRDGRMMFIAPKPWHPFFASINIQWVIDHENRELFW
jgi:hypothetical protein